MERTRLKRLRQRIDDLRRRLGGIKPRELEALAKGLGRKRHPKGKEPTWVSELPSRWPLSIPNHPGDLKKETARSILEDLEADLYALEELNETPDDRGLS